MKKIIFSILFFVNLTQMLYAQQQRLCGTYDMDMYLKSTLPGYAEQRDAIEKKIFNAPADVGNKIAGSTLVIPVVVHIIYNTPDQNISDEQIKSEIDGLNEDYEGINANVAAVPVDWSSLAGDANIRFQLARQDENGNATNGITRTATSVTAFNISDNEMKFDSTGGHNAWNRNHFLNLWVCNLGGNVLGYAQYPGSPASIDGVVITYKTFGRIGSNLLSQYDFGRTTTHEIGHWLNLYHIWGDDGGTCNGTDLIDDTPNQAKETYGCSEIVKTDACSPSAPGIMYQNYMDYTDDRCMMLFTTDQRTRMNDVITNSRNGLAMATQFLNSPVQFANDLKILAVNAPAGLNCVNTVIPHIVVENAGSNVISDFTVEYGIDTATTSTFTWTGNLAAGSTETVLLPEMNIPQDLHVFLARIIDVNNAADDFPSDNFMTRSFLYSPQKYACPAYPANPEVSLSHNLVWDDITITSLFQPGQNVTVSIYNLIGKRIYTTTYIDPLDAKLKMDINGLAAGMYIAQIKNFNSGFAAKFVVVH